MLDWIKSKRRIIIGVAAGMVAGYLYYTWVGCSSGSCAITSKPLNSALYFGFIGGLMGDMLKKNQTVKNVNHE
ncbi:MAG: hypothetical protein K1X54_00260 [Flavobacteriales bacterium]|nr:hypothetical protein [Flavobacteriales bacterium]